MKRVLTVQDVSCVGKCSLTVALPVISAMGVEACPLPTALLSNHTAFSEFTMKDLTDQIAPIMDTLIRQDITFDGIYTGYLSSVEQIMEVEKLFTNLKKEHTLIVVDPAMGDNGTLYSDLNVIFSKYMSKLCGLADVILPNVTEACYMTGIPYKETYDRDYIKTLMKETAKLGAGCVVMTGITLDEGKIGAACLDCYTGKSFVYQTEKIGPGSPGTGDVFASAFMGCIMRGFSIEQAVKLAADFTLESIRCTESDPEKRWYGVNFEQAIPFLLASLEG